MISKVNIDFISLIILSSLLNTIRIARLAVCVLLLNTVVIADEYQEYEMLNLTAGQVGILDDLDGPQRYGMEYRFKSFSGPWDFRLIPAVGAAISNNGAGFVYTDLRHDFYMSRWWLLIPSFGVGVFNDSSEIDLGSNIEFRSGIELAYQFNNKVRAGIAIFHLSNGGISSQNPGTEALVLSICIPMMGN